MLLGVLFVENQFNINYIFRGRAFPALYNIETFNSKRTKPCLEINYRSLSDWKHKLYFIPNGSISDYQGTLFKKMLFLSL